MSIRKLAMRFQAFLLRNNMMGPAGNILMSLKVKGRVSNKPYSIPVGYMDEGSIIYAINPGGNSQWFKNIQVNSEVELTIKGKISIANAAVITHEAERLEIFNLYKEKQAANFPRLFFVEVNAPEDKLVEAMGNTQFVKFVRN